MQDALFIQADATIAAKRETPSLRESVELSPKEDIQPTQITRSGGVMQDVACFQHVPGISSVFYEAVLQYERYEVFGRFTDKLPTISSSVELITSAFSYYEQEGFRPLKVWTGSSALYRGGPAHPYERYLAQQDVEHWFWPPAFLGKPAIERYFRYVRRFFVIARLRLTPWTLDELWDTFEAWDRAASGASS